MFPTNDVNLARFCQFEGFFQERSQLREQWHRSAFLAVVSFGLGTWNDDAVPLPIDMPPFEG